MRDMSRHEHDTNRANAEAAQLKERRTTHVHYFVEGVCEWCGGFVFDSDSDLKFQRAVDNAIAEENRLAIEEARAIDACTHARAEVTETDESYDRGGRTVAGELREFIDCPDCPLSDWFTVAAPEREL